MIEFLLLVKEALGKKFLCGAIKHAEVTLLRNNKEADNAEEEGADRREDRRRNLSFSFFILLKGERIFKIQDEFSLL